MIQGNNGKNGMDGIKGDKGDMGLHGFRGIQVEINIIKLLYLEVFFFFFYSFVLCLVFFYRVTKDCPVCQETKGGRVERCCGCFCR